MEIVPFQPGHLLKIVPQASQKMDPALDSAELRGTTARKLKAAGPCWTLRAGRAVLVCGGFVDHRPHHASLWSVMAEGKRGGLAHVTQFLRRQIAERVNAAFAAGCAVARIDMTVDPADAASVRWAIMLGFRFEAGREAYGANGQSMHEYAIIRRAA